MLFKVNCTSTECCISTCAVPTVCKHNKYEREPSATVLVDPVYFKIDRGTRRRQSCGTRLFWHEIHSNE